MWNLPGSAECPSRERRDAADASERGVLEDIVSGGNFIGGFEGDFGSSPRVGLGSLATVSWTSRRKRGLFERITVAQRSNLLRSVHQSSDWRTGMRTTLEGEPETQGRKGFGHGCGNAVPGPDRVYGATPRGRRFLHGGVPHAGFSGFIGTGSNVRIRWVSGDGVERSNVEGACGLR